jgi:NACalpha-BTF3-like transcription factor
MKSQLPGSLRSTVERRQHELEHHLENCIAALERLDEARRVIGLGPSERLFFLRDEVEVLIVERIAAHEAERAAKAKPLSVYEQQKAERERAKLGLDDLPSAAECAAIVQAVVEGEQARKALEAAAQDAALEAALKAGVVLPLRRANKTSEAPPL